MRVRGWTAAIVSAAVVVSAMAWLGADQSGTEHAVETAAEIPLTLHQAIPAQFVVPGAAPRLPWPAGGQGALDVVGVGELGSFGPADTPVPIASVAKSMTAYLVLQDHPLAPGDDGPIITITDDEAATYRDEAAHTGDSLVPVVSGEQLSERQALYALMLASADNVAQILAQWDAGTTTVFLGRMNALAARLGMVHTTFTDPSGLDAGTTSTAADLIRLGEAAIERPDFRQIVSTAQTWIPVAGEIRNYNHLLGTDGVFGIKTGSTGAAGSCLLFAADVVVSGQTRTIVGAVLGQPLGGYDVVGPVIAAVRPLVEAAVSDLGSVLVAGPGMVLATVRRGKVQTGRLTASEPVTVIGWPGLVFRIAVGGDPTHATVTASIANSDVGGNGDAGAGSGAGLVAQGEAGTAAGAAVPLLPIVG